MANLYELTVKRGMTFSVVADDPTEAQTELESLLTKANWWFEDRKVVNIKLVAIEYHCFPGEKPCFSDKFQDLIIVRKNTPQPH